MIILRETDKALKLDHNGIQFWVQRRWRKPDGTLTPAGKKAMAIAANEQRRHANFDASKTFTVIKETAKAVLLECEVIVPNERQHVQARFWIPRSMIGNHQFVTRKVREIESGFPFVGTKAIWPTSE